MQDGISKDNQTREQAQSLRQTDNKATPYISAQQVTMQPASGSNIIQYYASSINQVMLPIVPMKVINPENSLSMEVCALLDSGSSGTFYTDYITKTLNSAGRMCTYNLANFKDVKQKQCKIVKLIVSDVNNNIKINLLMFSLSLC